MKTKKRIKILEEQVDNLQKTVASLILRDFRLDIPESDNWKIKEPYTTGTPLHPNPIITSGDPFPTEPTTSSTVTNKDDVPFTYTAKQ